MARVFISYAREDLTRAREVHRWLMDAGLRWADAVVCVVTGASVASSWCTAEIVVAQERGSRLVPLRAEPNADHPLLVDVHHIDLVQDPATARAAVFAGAR